MTHWKEKQHNQLDSFNTNGIGLNKITIKNCNLILFTTRSTLFTLWVYFYSILLSKVIRFFSQFMNNSGHLEWLLLSHFMSTLYCFQRVLLGFSFLHFYLSTLWLYYQWGNLVSLQLTEASQKVQSWIS